MLTFKKLKSVPHVPRIAYVPRGTNTKLFHVVALRVPQVPQVPRGTNYKNIFKLLLYIYISIYNYK